MRLDSFLTVMSVCLLIVLWQPSTSLLVNALPVGVRLVNPRVDFILRFGRYSAFSERLIPPIILKATHENSSYSTYLVSTF